MVAAYGGYVYILEMRGGRLYVGSTRKILDRYRRHRKGKSAATKGWLPLKLVYLKGFETYGEAYAEERRIKAQKSRVIVERMIAAGIRS
jgi:predicted GIY-YIG superfamily endonuclease